jgi:hypothetical protein
MLNGEMYVVYYGPSELGKSIAVAHHPALQGRQGVVYLRMQEATSDLVVKRLLTSLRYSGDLQQLPGVCFICSFVIATVSSL